MPSETPHSTPPSRYSFQPVDDLLDIRLADATSRGGQLVGASDVQKAKTLSRSRRMLSYWRQNGLMRDTAEALAEALGVLAYDLWPGLLDDLIAEQERVCADCPRRFIPSDRNPHQRFCSHNCQKRAQMRRRYRAIPPEQRAPIRGAYRTSWLAEEAS